MEVRLDASGLLPDELVERVAVRFRILGQPVRIRLIDRLKAGPACVQELSVALGIAQQNVSQHLLLLYRAGIVRRRRDGTSVWYSLADPDAVGAIEAAAMAAVRQLRDRGDHLGEDRGG